MKLSLESDNLNIAITHPESDLEDENERYSHYDVAMLFTSMLEKMRIPRPLCVLCQMIEFMDDGGELGCRVFHPDQAGMVVEAASDYLEAWKESDAKLGLL